MPSDNRRPMNTSVSACNSFHHHNAIPPAAGLSPIRSPRSVITRRPAARLTPLAYVRRPRRSGRKSIKWVGLMCELMFGEHRESISQIILTAARGNVCFCCIKRGSFVERKVFLLSVAEVDEGSVKGKCRFKGRRQRKILFVLSSGSFQSFCLVP